MQISQVTPILNNSINKTQKGFNNNYYGDISFTSGPIKPESKFFAHIKKYYRDFMDPIENKIAKGFANLIQTEAAKKIITETAKRNNFGDKLFAHLIVLGSTLMSGFYVAQTLTNDKLDEKKRKTLAINQTAVFLLSTILAYTFDGLMTDKTNAIKDKFKAINKDVPNLDKQLRGIDAAKKIMIFTTMYRFVAPVLVTPLANYIGNRINEKH